MRVYQFRQFRINHDLLLLRKFVDMSSVLGDRIFKLRILDKLPFQGILFWKFLLNYFEDIAF
jgi:hypothetical protein